MAHQTDVATKLFVSLMSQTPMHSDESLVKLACQTCTAVSTIFVARWLIVTFCSRAEQAEKLLFSFKNSLASFPGLQ